jgi:hypothetical protein
MSQRIRVSLLVASFIPYKARYVGFVGDGMLSGQFLWYAGKCVFSFNLQPQCAVISLPLQIPVRLGERLSSSITRKGLHAYFQCIGVD